MKKNVIVKILAGVLSVTLLVGGTVLASDGSRNIDIFFRNIKIMIDGAEYVPTDSDGNVVEPFIYNGTTYLPVRAVANAFGKDVKWDGENATVYLGKESRMEPDNRLDKIQYLSYWEEDSSSKMEIINGKITDYNNNIYTNGLCFSEYGSGNGIKVEYPINGQYDKFTGTIVLPQNIQTTTWNEKDCRTEETTVIISDENDNELFKANGITASMPFKFDINVEGVLKIKIHVDTGIYGYSRAYVALTDLALYE